MFRFVDHCCKIKIFLFILILSAPNCSMLIALEEQEETGVGSKRKLNASSSEEEVEEGSEDDAGELPIFPLSENRALKILRAPILKKGEDSDDEEEAALEKFPEVLPIEYRELVERGTQVKLMANVYLRSLCQRANVFIPSYVAEFEDPAQESQKDFFRTARNQICVFVSGGLQNAWEKTVAWAFKKFFGSNIKIIRARWVQKHLFKDKKKSVRLEDQYKGREEELHSELYFEYFFRNLFDLSVLNGKRGTFTIRAFSWWDVCDSCFNRLGSLRQILPEGFSLNYEIISHRHYSHKHHPSFEFRERRAIQVPEKQAWNTIWEKIMRYAGIFSANMAEKNYFWTKTKDGLEICKWLAQAFSGRNGQRRTASKGDISKYFGQISKENFSKFNALMEFLEQANWDLSCWYREIPYHVIQRNWERQWSFVVMPHFGWTCIFHWGDPGLQGECDMCGKEGLRHTYWVYHPKFRVAKAQLSEETLVYREASDTFNPSSYFDLHPEEWKRRKQSLVVGGECLKKLETSQATIEEWRQSEAYCNQRLRIKEDRELAEAERGLKERVAAAREERKGKRRKK